MNGIQKTVVLGLRHLARKVEDRAYGKDDEAFQIEHQTTAFLEDLEDEVIGKME